MERIRRMQQDSKGHHKVDSESLIEEGKSMELVPVTGWKSASKSKPINTWIGRYQRALTFLRIRGMFKKLKKCRSQCFDTTFTYTSL